MHGTRLVGFVAFFPDLFSRHCLHIMVSKTVSSIESLDDLKFFVYQTLCRDHDLLMNAFPTTETILKRGRQPGDAQSCGMMFCLHGPRAVKFSAIWEKKNNRVLFYGPSGRRYLQVGLQGAEISIEKESSELCTSDTP